MTTLRLVAALGAAAALAALAGADSALAQQPNPWTWRGNIPAGRTLEVRGVAGTITAERASGRATEVAARKTAEDDDPDDVTIEVVEHADGITICAVYPGRGNTCEPGGGRMRIRDNNDVEVDFTVRVPDGVEFIGANVSGDVRATGLTADVQLGSVSGDVSGTGLGGAAHLTSVSGTVELETSAGEATATSVSGDVRATVRGSGTRPLRFTSVSGDVRVSLPRDLGADIEVSTVSGDFESDFPVTMTGRVRRSRISGRIGSGGRDLTLDTVSGSVEIRALR